MTLTVDLVIELGIHGHRADIGLLKAAKALAALLGKDDVSMAELREVADFVLPHRLPGSALLGQQEAVNLLKDAFGKIAETEKKVVPLATDPLDDYDEYLDTFDYPGPAAAGSSLFEMFKKKLQSA